MTKKTPDPQSTELPELPTTGGVFSYDPEKKTMTQIEGQADEQAADPNPATPGETS